MVDDAIELGIHHAGLNINLTALLLPEPRAGQPSATVDGFTFGFNENYARSQQRLANASSMILGNQVTNQWGSLAAAANGAVGAPTGVGYTPGIGQNANAGAQGNAAANSNFNTLSNIWNTAANIAAQDNKQKIGAISGAAGAAAGGI